MVGDWKSLLSNLGGTGPCPTGDGGGGGAGGVAAAIALVDGVDSSAPADVEGKKELADVHRGSLVTGELHETATSGAEDVATVVDETVADADAAAGADKAEASACLALFLAAALVCQPHEHEVGLPAVKNDPRWHRLIAAIAANTSLLEGFWPLPVNTGFPSARSISCSEYWPTPRKW